MKVRVLKKRLSRVVQPKQFHSVGWAEEAEIEVEPNETVEEAEKKLYDLVAQMLHNDIERWKESVRNAAKKS